MTFDPAPGTRAWFAVIASGRLVEIVDGPFGSQHEARICAARHNQDGERGAHARLRYVPRVRSWAPIFGPKEDDVG